MKIHTKIALLGATGKAGKYLVNQLLENGYSVKALIRDPKNYALTHPLLEIVEGDIKEFETAVDLLTGCDVVISAIGQIKGETLISSLATANIIMVMDRLNIKRYILLTGSNLDIPGDQKSQRSQEGAAWMRNTFPVEVADKQRTYDILSSTSLDWTLVRLPWIEQTDERRGLSIDLLDSPGERISTTDLADFLIQQITDTRYIRQVPFVASLPECV